MVKEVLDNPEEYSKEVPPDGLLLLANRRLLERHPCQRSTVETPFANC